ncbi:MAG: amino acid permease, partial [Proteobacteria bacterium]
MLRQLGSPSVFFGPEWSLHFYTVPLYILWIFSEFNSTTCCRSLRRVSHPMKKNQLSLFTALSIVIGCVIGSGVFVKPGKVLLATGESSTAILAWVLGGVLTLAGGLTVAEIASRIPKTGGLYVFMEEIYGKRWGFVSGWVQALIYGPGLMSALALYFGSLFVNFFGMDPAQAKGVSFISLFLLAGISAWGTRYSAWIQNISTVIKLLPIALIGVAGLFMGHEPIFNQTLTDPNMQAVGLGSAILATLWAYDGWMQVANVAGDIENPAKNLPRAIVGGLTAVMIVYVLVNISLFHVLPKDQIALLNEKSAGLIEPHLKNNGVDLNYSCM